MNNLKKIGSSKPFSMVHFKKTFPIFCMITFYFLIFSFATVTKYYSLKTTAYDLGNYNQALYTTLRGYGLLYYTADLPANPSGSMMGVHFSPILIIILPIYAIYPAPPTLLILQSFVLALGAFPIYWLGQHLLKTRLWGLLFAALYLLNPVLHGINWFDFHPEAFFITFFLFSIYYGLREEWLKYFLSSLLTLTTIEYAAILVAFNSVYLLWLYKKEVKASLEACKSLNIRRVDARMKYPLLILIAAFLWFIIALQVISLFSPKNPMVDGGAPQWSILGAKGIFDVPLKTILSPEKAFEALTYDLPLKLIYLLIIFGYTAFLSIFSAKTLISTLPWLGIALLSNYAPFYYVGTQYPAFLLPPIMIGSVIGARKILNGMSKKNLLPLTSKKLAATLIIVSLFSSVLISPLYEFHFASWPALEHLNAYGLPSITEHDNTVMRILSLVPENASILTQQNIFPLVSSRKNSFVIPWGTFYPPGTNFNTTFNQWLQQSDFVLVDLKTSPFETLLVYTHIENFKVYASSDGIILLKRNYSSDPVLLEPYENLLNWKNLQLINGVVVVDSTSDSQQVLLHSSEESSEEFWRGPRVYLSPGTYKVTFRLKMVNVSDQSMVAIGIYGSPFELTSIMVGTEETGYNLLFTMKLSNVTINYGSEFLSDKNFTQNVYNEFDLTFSVNIPMAFEFKGSVVHHSCDLYLDWIKIVQLSALP